MRIQIQRHDRQEDHGVMGDLSTPLLPFATTPPPKKPNKNGIFTRGECPMADRGVGWIKAP